MHNTLIKYTPEKAVPLVIYLINEHKINLKIVNQRQTKHGDFRTFPNGQTQITVNNNLNKYQFLLTLIHEIAHLEAFSKFGRHIKPHGAEWKRTFQHLMLPFINPQVFPEAILPVVAKHFINPKASSDTDVQLALALKLLDAPNNKSFIFEVPLHQTFKIHNGRVFKKGAKRRTRHECVEVKTGKTYLFNANAEVEILNN